MKLALEHSTGSLFGTPHTPLKLDATRALRMPGSVNPRPWMTILPGGRLPARRGVPTDVSNRPVSHSSLPHYGHHPIAACSSQLLVVNGTFGAPEHAIS